MKKLQHIFSFSLILLLVSSLQSCKDDGFALSCGNVLTVAEGATEVIEVKGNVDFSLETDNTNAACIKNGNTITVTGVKVGETKLTVSDNAGNRLTCTITVIKSDAQKNFINDRTPRVENWLQEILYTEQIAGVQATRERNIDADGYVAEGTTTYGFYLVETGDFCRVSATGDFADRGTYQNGKIAICSSGEVKYHLCESVEVKKAYDGHVWIVVTCKDLPEIRIVTEKF